MDIINTLRSESSVAYDPNNKSHEKLLQNLWDLACPTTPLESRINDQWKELGFQSHDPATDFRAGGIFSLKNLIYFVKKYPERMKIIINERKEYPFAASAINISRMFLYHYKISQNPKMCPCCNTSIMKLKDKPTPEIKDLLKILVNDGTGKAIDEIISVGILAMDDIFVRKQKENPNFNVLQFRDVFKEVTVYLRTIFNRHPKDLDEFIELSQRIKLNK